MTQPAKPNSLRDLIERRICKIPGYENLNQILRSTPEGKRADYTAFDRKLIIEQKEHLDSPQHRLKGLALHAFTTALEDKYNLTVDELLEQSIISEQERKIFLDLKNNFYNKIKSSVQEADKQIASTKILLKIYSVHVKTRKLLTSERLLISASTRQPIFGFSRERSIPESIGVLLLVFEQVSGIIFPVIHERIGRIFASETLYINVDIVIFACIMKDMLMDGSPNFVGHISRSSEDATHLDYAKQIRLALNEGAVNVRPASGIIKKTRFACFVQIYFLRYRREFQAWNTSGLAGGFSPCDDREKRIAG
jgi:hypothetical protein